MRNIRTVRTALLLGLALALAACGDSPIVGGGDTNSGGGDTNGGGGGDTAGGDTYGGDTSGGGGGDYAGTCAVVSVTPTSGAQNVPLTTGVVLTFSGAISTSPLTGLVGLRQGATPVAVNINGPTGAQVTLTPTAPLAYGTQYTVFAGAGIMCNGAATPSEYTSTFTTVANPNAPTGFLFSPVGGTTSGGGYTIKSIGGQGLGGTTSGGGYTITSEGAQIIPQ